MIEVNFSSSEHALIEEYSRSTNKSATDWANKSFKSIRRTIKDHYLKEQNYTCCFCQRKTDIKHHRAWDTEHIIARSTHPAFMFHPKNLCVACIECNTEKRNKEVLSTSKKRVRFPSNSNAYLIIHPHFDIYEEHLTVLVEGEVYRWITPKGRATHNIYGLDRFLKIAGRIQLTEPKVKQLSNAILASNDLKTSKSLELEMLKFLLVKCSGAVGAERSMDMLKVLNGV